MTEQHEHSYANYQALRKRGEDCEGCRAKCAEYAREYRKTRPDTAKLGRRRVAARDRALRALAARHPAEFAVLLKAERAKIAEEMAS